MQASPFFNHRRTYHAISDHPAHLHASSQCRTSPPRAQRPTRHTSPIQRALREDSWPSGPRLKSRSATEGFVDAVHRYTRPSQQALRTRGENPVCLRVVDARRRALHIHSPPPPSELEGGATGSSPGLRASRCPGLHGLRGSEQFRHGASGNARYPPTSRSTRPHLGQAAGQTRIERIAPRAPALAPSEADAALPPRQASNTH